MSFPCRLSLLKLYIFFKNNVGGKYVIIAAMKSFNITIFIIFIYNFAWLIKFQLLLMLEEEMYAQQQLSQIHCFVYQNFIKLSWTLNYPHQTFIKAVPRFPTLEGNNKMWSSSIKYWTKQIKLKLHILISPKGSWLSCWTFSGYDWSKGSRMKLCWRT